MITMAQTLTMRLAPRTAADELAAEFVRKAVRWVLVALGALVILLGVLIAPLPGPMGLPIVVVGLMIVLRNSFRARREFIKFQRKHPRIVFPIRRLLRREPEVFPVAWQQVMRVEKLVLPKSWRMARRMRRRWFRRPR